MGNSSHSLRSPFLGLSSLTVPNKASGQLCSAGLCRVLHPTAPHRGHWNFSAPHSHLSAPLAMSGSSH